MRAQARGLFLAVVLSVIGCTAAKVEPCSDGEEGAACATSCSVSLSCPTSSPICDGTSSTCRPCVAGEDRYCRDRGSDTPHCVGGRCVACVPPRGVPVEVKDCAASTPICDGNACRACTRHSECLSGVCAKDISAADLGIQKGSCVPSEQVLIVDQDLCSRNGPIYCTPQQAFLHVGPMQRYVLLRRGATPEDFSSLVFGDLPAQTTQLVRIIGPLADNPPHRSPGRPQVAVGGLPGKNGLTITHGRVILEGLFVRDNNIGLGCTGSDAEVEVRRAFLSGNDTAISASGGCKLTVADTWIGSGPAGTGFAGLAGNTRGLVISGAEFHLVNTVFVDDGDYGKDALGGILVHSLGGARSTVVNTTFYQQHGLIKAGKYLTSLICDVPVADRLLLLNTLLLSEDPLSIAPEEHYIDRACGARIEHSGSNDPTLRDNDNLLLPEGPMLFVDSKGRDLRPIDGTDAGQMALKTGGVRQTFVGSDEVLAPDSDLDGQPRDLSGDRVALGAFDPVMVSAP